MKQILSIVLALLLALSLSAALAEPADGAVTVILNEVGNNLDPSFANAINITTIANHIYDNILECDTSFTLQPGVASAWEQPDDLTIVLTIGEGFVFHNGDALTVDDVVYSINRLENIAQTANLFAKIDSVQAEGNQVTITLKEADSNFVRELSTIPVLNKAYCEAAGEDYANTPIGTGPYRLASFVPGEEAVLAAWEDYPFEPKASIGTITFRGISEASTAYMAVEAGDADFTSINATDYERAQSNESLVFYEGESTYTAFVAMNTQAAPFDNVNVRKAMAYAYNKEAYLNVKGVNYSTIDSMFPAMTDYYHHSEDTITYDLDRARELLEAEGYNASSPLVFQISGYNEDPVMQAYQADLMSIGVQVDLQTLEFGVFLDNMVNQNYQMLTGGWGDTTGNPLTSAECYWSGSFGSQNISFYENALCDELYVTAKGSGNQDEVVAACHQIQDIAWQDVPMFPTFTRTEAFAYNNRLDGIVISPSGVVSFRSAVLK